MLYSGQTTVGLGDHVALRVGGLKRDANDYILPKDLQTDERRQDSTFADSKNYNAGLSWIGDRGFIGASFSQRHDQYGIPAENELLVHVSVMACILCAVQMIQLIMGMTTNMMLHGLISKKAL